MKSDLRLPVLLFSLCALLGSLVPAQADVALNGLFSDHMVLQRDTKVSVWGTAAPAEEVTVTFGKQTVKAVADRDGKWILKLDPMPASTKPTELLVVGKNKVKIEDVLVGDVWLCSGQSNMAFHMRQIKENPLYRDDLTSANFPLIRHAFVAKNPSDKPLSSVPVSWTVCSPTTVGEFSAAAFYFAREIQGKLSVPIGLINSSVGGTSAQSWSSIDSLRTDAHLKEMSEQQIADFAKAPEMLKNLSSQLNAWEKKYGRVDSENTGEKQEWETPDLVTTDWKKASAMISKKESGTPDGGVIWIRKEITIPTDAAGKGFHLTLGYIANATCTVYFNDEKVGEKNSKIGPTTWDLKTDLGSFKNMTFGIPSKLVKAGKNVIAVRFVSDTGMDSWLRARPNGWDMGFPGAKDLSEECQFKVEKQFPPLSQIALAEMPILPSRDAGGTASYLFNGMINPLAPYTIKGLLWYQGEQDSGRGFVYRTLLPIMLTGWRKLWAQGDFPIVIQQLPNYGASSSQPGRSDWAELREAQAMTAKQLPNCALSVGINIGEARTFIPRTNATSAIVSPLQHLEQSMVRRSASPAPSTIP